MNAMTMRIDIVSDAICPWCWIGRANLAAALEELGEDASTRAATLPNPPLLNQEK